MSNAETEQKKYLLLELLTWKNTVLIKLFGENKEKWYE